MAIGDKYKENNDKKERVKSPRIPTDSQPDFLRPLSDQEALGSAADKAPNEYEQVLQKKHAEQEKQAKLEEQEKKAMRAEQEKKAMQAKQKVMQNTKENNSRSSKTLVHIGVILDATYSFSCVFPGIYLVLKEFMERMKTNKKKYPGGDFRYGLTVLHDEAESLRFGGDEFTASEDTFMKKLMSIRFSGGGEDGKENLYSAIFEQIKTFSTYKDYDKDHSGESKYWRVYDGLIMLTDSLPKDENMEPDFSKDVLSVEKGFISNNGLRFAQFYAFNDEFNPVMRMVDRDGNQTEGEKNSVIYDDIHELLKGDLKTAIKKVESMIDCIIRQTSVGA